MSAVISVSYDKLTVYEVRKGVLRETVFRKTDMGGVSTHMLGDKKFQYADWNSRNKLVVKPRRVEGVGKPKLDTVF